MQAAATTANVEGPRRRQRDAMGPYGPFKRISIGGYCHKGAGNIYLAAVKPNPVDAEQRTLLGLFPVNLGLTDEANGNGHSFIGISLSCDGFAWSPLHRLASSRSLQGRPVDHPVDGVLLRDGGIYVLLHRDVPLIGEHGRSRIETYRVNEELLLAMTRAAHVALPGCSTESGMRPVPDALPSQSVCGAVRAGGRGRG